MDKETKDLIIDIYLCIFGWTFDIADYLMKLKNKLK